MSCRQMEDRLRSTWQGGLARGDEYEVLTSTSASWIIEVDARQEVIQVAIVPTPLEVSVTPEATERRFSIERARR